MKEMSNHSHQRGKAKLKTFCRYSHHFNHQQQSLTRSLCKKPNPMWGIHLILSNLHPRTPDQTQIKPKLLFENDMMYKVTHNDQPSHLMARPIISNAESVARQ